MPDTWVGYSPYAYEHLPIQTKYLSSSDVLKFRDDAYVRYYGNERYQKMVEEKFGKEVLFSIKKGLTKKLKRKYLEEAAV
ncbi:MAG: hypothetical protein MRK02_09960 [Candidatus Scalindua sp.]|nr:hypothetical protein [Candidatus Scalindua sp.]